MNREPTVQIRLRTVLCGSRLHGEVGEIISVPAEEATALIKARAGSPVDEREERIRSLEAEVAFEQEFLAAPPGPPDDDWTPGPEFPR